MNPRIVVAEMMFVSAFACATLLLAEPLSPSQQKASQNCDRKFLDDVARCLREHPQLTVDDCQKAAYQGYKVCRKSAGLPMAAPPKSPKVPHDRAGGNKPTISQPTATPDKGASVRGASRIDSTTMKASTPTPTPTPHRRGGSGERKG
jgi:hypothetical protein